MLMRFNPLSYAHNALQGLLAAKPGMPLPADLAHDFSIVIAVTLVLVMACAFPGQPTFVTDAGPGRTRAPDPPAADFTAIVWTLLGLGIFAVLLGGMREMWLASERSDFANCRCWASSPISSWWRRDGQPRSLADLEGRDLVCRIFLHRMPGSVSGA
jgi:hypothetical protein